MLRHILLLLAAGLATSAAASENNLGTVYLPLAGLQGELRIERVPAVLGHVSPEQEIAALAKPFHSVQTTSVAVPDSNLVTLYGLKIACERLPTGVNRVEIDVRGMKHSEQYEHTNEEVVEATLICLRLMFPAGSGTKITVRIISAPEQRERWLPFERAFFPPPP